MSKISPKISAPGSAKFPTKGPHNPNVGTHGGGGALAKVAGVGSSSAASFRTGANLQGAKIGQKVPDTAAAATKKPNRKGEAAFYGLPK